jgi:hypothetical protein
MQSESTSQPIEIRRVMPPQSELDDANLMSLPIGEKMETQLQK